MGGPGLAMALGAALAVVLAVLVARGLLSLRQAAAALAGLVCGAVLGWTWAGGGHG